MKVEDDAGMIVLDGEEISIEQAKFKPKAGGDRVVDIIRQERGGRMDNHLIRQEKGGWVDGGNDVEFLTYSGGNFNKVKNVPDMGAMNGNFVTLVPGLFGSSSDSVINPTPNPNPNPGGKPDIDIQLFYPYGDFTSTQRAIFEQAANNWEGIITRDKVESGVLKIAITQGSRGIEGKVWGDTAAETWQDEEPNYRHDFTTDRWLSGNNFDGDNRIHFNPKFFNRIKNYNLCLAMHEIGHTLGLNEANPGFDTSLLDSAGDSLMDLKAPEKGGQDMKITEGMYRQLEWLGYGVNRQFRPNWQ
ncbi:MAG: hypothetical protein WBG66_04955 [Geitlerinemataceae cyanobacterium]